jgi:hypothetical protein
MTPKRMRPSSVRGEVDGSVKSKCIPRKTATGMYESMKKYDPVAARYARLQRYVVTTADIVIVVTPNRNCPGSPTRKSTR